MSLIKHFLLMTFFLFIFMGCELQDKRPIIKEIPYSTMSVSGSRSVSRAIDLSWNVQTDEKVSYDLYLSTEKKYYETTLVAKQLRESFYYPPKLFKENTQYFWKVRANYANSSAISDGYSFKTNESQEKPGRYYLLTVGISNYNINGSPFKDLALTPEDADDYEKVAQRLNEPYQITKLTGIVTKKDIYSKLEPIIRNSQANDHLVFTYSGHGHNFPPSLVMSNSPTPPSKNEGLYSSKAYNEANILINEFQSKLKLFKGSTLVLIDSCFSGYFKDIKLTAIQQRQQVEQLSSQILDIFFENSTINEEGSVLSSLSTRSKESQQLTVITATSSTQLSYEEGQQLANGIFSYTATNGLGLNSKPLGSFDYSFDADSTKNNKITYSEFFNYTKFKTAEIYQALVEQGKIISDRQFSQSVQWGSTDPFGTLTLYFDNMGEK